MEEIMTKNERKTVRTLVLWILVAVIVLEGGVIAYLAQLCSKTDTAGLSGTALDGTEGYERQDMCNHFLAITPGYSDIIAYYVVTEADGSETQYETPEDVLIAFSKKISKGIETPQEAAGKSVVATEYRYCQDCSTFYEYGTLTITSYVQTVTVSSVEDFFDNEDYDKILYIDDDDEGVIYYCFRIVTQTVVQFFSDLWDSMFNDPEIEEYTVECLAYTMDEQARYTAEEYQEILNMR